MFGDLAVASGLSRRRKWSTPTQGKPWAQALVPGAQTTWNRLGKMSNHTCKPGFPNKRSGQWNSSAGKGLQA